MFTGKSRGKETPFWCLSVSPCPASGRASRSAATPGGGLWLAPLPANQQSLSPWKQTGTRTAATRAQLHHPRVLVLFASDPDAVVSEIGNSRSDWRLQVADSTRIARNLLMPLSESYFDKGKVRHNDHNSDVISKPGQQTDRLIEEPRATVQNSTAFWTSRQ